MQKNVVLQKATALFHRAGAYCTENPLKVYSGIFLLGDLIMGASTNGLWLWRAGAIISMVANANKLVFGKGGEPVDASTFRITKEGAKETLKNMVVDPWRLFGWKNLKGIVHDIRAQRPRDLVTKAKRARAFWRYPLDAGWMMYVTTGSCYAMDALCFGGLSRPMDFFIGAWGATASALGFVTENNKTVGRMFGLLCMLSLTTGIVTKNPPLVVAPIIYMYGCHVVGRVETALQSGYTAKNQMAAP